MSEPDGGPGSGLAPISTSLTLEPVMDLQTANARLEKLQLFCQGYLQESKDGGNDGGDYGVIPGAGQKKVLLKSGADKLCDVYALADAYTILSKVEDFDRGLFDYSLECRLTSKVDGRLMGTGLGSCSSFESKYRWRDRKRTCPACDQATILKSREEYGGGWFCFVKKGGCGAKFDATDPLIIDQPVGGRVENPDIIDAKNTVLKMAKKRAKIDAVISVTRSSGIFTQDEEFHQPEPAGEPQSVGTGQTAAAKDKPPPPANETQKEKIARIKREAGKGKADPAKLAPEERRPEPGGSVAAADGHGPGPEHPPAAPATPLPAGAVHIAKMGIKNGPIIVKDGVSKPEWGPLYVITFSTKVRASDGAMVNDASTFDEKVADVAAKAKDDGMPVQVLVVPAKRKGSYAIKTLSLVA